MRPALAEVDRRLLEAEGLAIETPRRVEVADVVPDLRGHQSARPGSSRNVFTVLRNSAPVAPSTARWSHVSVRISSGTTRSSPSRGTTWSRVEPTARIDACGGFSTAMHLAMSYLPGVAIVDGPPSRST